MGNIEIILASQSPRRSELLKEAGLNFKVIPAYINEDPKENESPKELVLRLAKEKAYSIAKEYKEAWVIGADTIVTINNKILGKPRDKTDAKNMLSELSGNTHSVISGIGIFNINKNIENIFASETKVSFRDLTEAEIDTYLETDEPYDKAGSYAIQGKAAKFIKSINGSYTNVVGIDVAYVVDYFLAIP